MNLDERIGKFRELIARRDEIDKQIAECLGDAALHVKVPRGVRQKKWHKANKRGMGLQSEIESHHSGKRHPETDRIEELLIEGKSTAEIMEEVQVSPPTIGVIRARLRKEGRLVL